MKTANNCYQAKVGELQKSWFLVDATDQVLGRLAARIAMVLMGKHRPTYTPHVDTGDFVVVVNAERIRVTGDKLLDKTYMHYTYYPSGHRRRNLRTVLEKHPEMALREAVRRMLPKNALARHMLTKLKLYRGETHPHQAQMPEPLQA